MLVIESIEYNGLWTHLMSPSSLRLSTASSALVLVSAPMDSRVSPISPSIPLRARSAVSSSMRASSNSLIRTLAARKG